jgi:hypothetical protein
MSAIPVFDGRAKPDTADREISLRWREVFVRLNELVHALPRDAKNFRDLRHTD